MRGYLAVCWILVVVALSHSQVQSTGCASRLDMVFIVDGSGSIELHNWMLMQDFLIEVINRLDIGQNKVRIGVVLYSNHAYTMWNLADPRAQSRRQLSNAIRDLPYLNGRTATPAGLWKARTEVFQRNGQRDNVQNVAVVITDGRSNEFQEIFHEQAQSLKDIARVVAIGITDSIDYAELQEIASTGCDIHTVDYFDQMDADMDATMDFICGCVPGYALDSDVCECGACGVDMYQPEWGQTECMDCPTGQGTLQGMAAVQCQDECPAGSRIKDDGSGCELCSVGTYQPDTAQSNCSACPTGYSTRGMGATSDLECELVCDKGQHPTEVSGQMECMECPIGTYQPGTFATMCIECPDGYSTRQTASTLTEQCQIECSAGQRPNENGTACVPCQLGFYQPHAFQLECEQCPTGYSTRQPGALSSDQCQVVCGRGESAVEVSGRMECEECSEGTYQPGVFATMCIDCPDGYNTRQSGSTLLEECEIVCMTGEEPNENGTACGLCPIGSYQDEAFGKQCRTCPPGESTREEGARHIDLCENLNPPGRLKDDGNSSNAGAIAGAVIGALLLAVLLVLLVFFLLRLRRKKAYAQSRTSSITAPVIGKMEKGLYDNGPDNSNHYDNGPTAKTPYDNTPSSESPYDNGANKENPYDNGANRENPYDNGANRENPYDNGANRENPYDNGANRENPYDNGPNMENPYDNGPNMESPYDNGPHVGIAHDTPQRMANPYDNSDTSNTVYDNSPKTERNVYDNNEEPEHVYNDIGDVEYAASAPPSEHPYEDPIQVQKHLGLDNPVYANT